MRRRTFRLPALLALLLTATGPAFGAAALKPTFTVPPGLSANLVASEPMFANPVALSVAPDGTVYVTETRRRKANRLDIRNNPDWLNESLAFQTVAEREAFLRAQFAPENSEQNRRRVADLNQDGSHDWRDLTALSDSIHKLTDADFDGVAESATEFAGGFNTVATDIAAGVLVHGENVYATIAPDLWRLRDTNGDGVADERESLVDGFGVKIAYAGHNMHGVVMGPDGRLYWSVADMGSDRLPNEGAIFRCEPDGSNVEVFARGLRNPQEFAFDDYGNLFAADNDSDISDRERWYHVVEGADYGWRAWWQYQSGRQWGSEPDTYFMWTEERIWHLWTPEQGAWHMPPTAHIGPGPCGMTAYPGVGMGPEFNGSFFVALFTGSANNSGVYRYTVEPKGATFALTAEEPFLTGLVPTGLDFAPDGSGLYLADWAGGWDLNDQGRVWRVTSPAHLKDDATLETRALLREDLRSKPLPQLINLLAHANRNVRQDAQFAIASAGQSALVALHQTAFTHTNQLARIHALRALEQVNRRQPGALAGVIDLLDDPDPEIRAQTAGFLGDGGITRAADALTRRLNDDSARVRFFAAMSLGKLGHRPAFDAVVELLARNGKDDLFLRYAGIYALEHIGDVEAITGLTQHPSADVRIAAAVALRRLESAEVEAFLHDTDPLVVVEAARAINDLPLPPAMERLAELAEQKPANDWIARRALNANLRLGGVEHAKRVAAYAADVALPEVLRREALRILADWASPNVRDRVVGAYRPLDPESRDADAGRSAFAEVLPQLLAEEGALKADALELTDRMKLELPPATLAAWVADAEQTDGARIAALRLLQQARGDAAVEAAQQLLSDGPESTGLFAEALRIQAENDANGAVDQLAGTLGNDEISKAQAALRILAGNPSGSFRNALSVLLREAVDGRLDPRLQLDVREAAGRLNDSAINELQEQFDAGVTNQPLGSHRLTLRGGDAERGRDIFFNKTELQCVRCHQADAGDEIIGGNAAPNLAGIGSRRDREHLLESIVQPNAAFSEGYEQVVLTLENGDVISGQLKNETEDHLVLALPAADDEEALFADVAAMVERRVKKSEIVERKRGLSAMPEGLAELMTPFELRDLIEFLATE